MSSVFGIMPSVFLNDWGVFHRFLGLTPVLIGLVPLLIYLDRLKKTHDMNVQTNLRETNVVLVVAAILLVSIGLSTSQALRQTVT